MRKNLLCLLLFFPFSIEAHNENNGKPVFKKAVTGFGRPAGKQTEFVIDENGGTLKSFDGELELIIPKDAIKKKTTITIQPVTNMLVLGTGKGYQLEPSDIKFRKPVILKFNVSNEEFRDSLTNLLGIAMQDMQGIWHEAFNSRLDSVKRTISCEINHFSVWSKFVALKIYPKYTRLKVGTMLALSLISTRNLFETMQENNAPRGSGLSMSSGGNNESGRNGSNHKNGMSKFELVESIAETGSGNDFPIAGSIETPGNTGTTSGKSSGKTGSNVTLTLHMEEIELIYVETDNSSGSSGSNVTLTLQMDEIELIEANTGGDVILRPPTAQEIADANPGMFEDGEIPLKEVEVTIGEAKEVANTGEVELTIGEVTEVANNGEVELTIGEATRVPEVELTIGEATEVPQSGDVELTMGEVTRVPEVELTMGEPRRVESDNWEAEWYVNGILNGNSTYGTIQPGSKTEALYSAPELVPDANNPVIVSVNIRGLSFERNGAIISNPTLKSKILLYDNAYKVTVECEFNGLDAGTRLGKAFYEDFGSFLVEVKKDKAEIKEIINQPDNWHYEGSCQCTPLSPGTGMVHIKNPNSVKVIPPLIENGISKVEMQFAPVLAYFTKVLISCPEPPALPFGGNFMGIRAYPMYIKFDAKEGKRRVFENGSRNMGAWVAIDVEKLSEQSVYFY